MQYYDIPKSEYWKKAMLATEDWNRFVDVHHRATCTACGRDYLYSEESPILRTPVWKEVLANLGLSEFEAESSSNFREYARKKQGFISGMRDRLFNMSARRGKTPSRKMLSAVRHFASLSMPVPDDCHCTLCEGCMERGLGRPLEAADIDTGCDMGRDYAAKRFGTL